MGASSSNFYVSKEQAIKEKQASSLLKKTKRDGSKLRSKAVMIKDYDESSMPWPLKPILHLDYCWRITYTMSYHSLAFAFPLTMSHYIWTNYNTVWKHSIKSFPYRVFLTNYVACTLMIITLNTSWSLLMDDYW